MTLTITDITNNLQNKWWLTTGIDPSEVVAVWQPYKNISLANSYRNLIDNDTHELSAGVAPTFDADSGWSFNGTSQYLISDVTPNSGYTALTLMNILTPVVKATSSYLIGEFANSASFAYRAILSNPASNIQRLAYRWAWANGIVDQTVDYATPKRIVVGQAGNVGYYTDNNGVLQNTSAISSTFSGTPIAFYLGAVNDSGSPTFYWPDLILAQVVYNTTLTTSQISAISANMLALSEGAVVKPNYIVIHPNTARLPQVNHILFTATDSGVYKSINGGSTWTQFELPNPSNDEFMDSPPATVDELTFNGFVFDPADYDTYYVLGVKNSSSRIWIYKSVDGGLNWTSRGVTTP